MRVRRYDDFDMWHLYSIIGIIISQFFRVSCTRCCRTEASVSLIVIIISCWIPLSPSVANKLLIADQQPTDCCALIDHCGEPGNFLGMQRCAILNGFTCPVVSL